MRCGLIARYDEAQPYPPTKPEARAAQQAHAYHPTPLCGPKIERILKANFCSTAFPI
jgi:hypothetical protein